MSKKEHGLIYTIIFTFIVCFIFVFGLVFVNQQTMALVTQNQQIASQAAVLNALGILYNNNEDILHLYSQIQSETINNVELLKSTTDNKTSYAKRFFGKGLWGTISGIIAVSEDLQHVVGLEIISHNETPGLGGRIEETWFTDQFRNERIINNTITVGSAGTGDTDKSNGKVDSITGASRTSNRLQIILQDELALLKELLGDKA